MRKGFTLLELIIVLALLVVLFGLSISPIQRMYVRSQLGSTARALQGELYETRLSAMKEGVPYVFRYQGGTPYYEILPKTVWDARNSTLTPGLPVQEPNPSGLSVARSVGTASLSENLATNSSNGSTNGLSNGSSSGLTTREPANGQTLLLGSRTPESSTVQSGYYLKELRAPYIFNLVEQPSPPTNPGLGLGGVTGPTTGDLSTVRSVGTNSADLANHAGSATNGNQSATLNSSLNPNSLISTTSNVPNQGPTYAEPRYLPDPNQSSVPLWSAPIFFFPNGRTSSGSLTILTTGDYLYRCEVTLRGLTGTARVARVELIP
ncbi:MAG: pilus assembly FimT family protein [Thermoguttaceae bacterium]